MHVGCACIDCAVNQQFLCPHHLPFVVQGSTSSDSESIGNYALVERFQFNGEDKEMHKSFLIYLKASEIYVDDTH